MLNDRQQEAVLCTEGPLLVVAGAGSGKTKMLTSRIAHLIESKAALPSEILAVTFTNKAAREMRERVQGQVGHLNPEIGTFHSICVRWLRREMAYTPFQSPFVIYDDADQLSVIKDVVKRLDLDDKMYPPKAFQGAINRAKCDALEPHEIEVEPHNIFQRHMIRVYELYQKAMIEASALDFGEILCLTVRLFRDFPDLRAKYQKRYRYIHVDEYQDTNRVQYLLLSLLANPEHGGHGNICVVGDEDQSIYAWRGADIRNILEFENDYPAARVVKLEQNYRSTQTILDAAHFVIKNNRTRKDKRLWTENSRGEQILRYQLPDERAEAELVIKEIKRLASSDGYSYNDFAVFYRTHAQSRQFEDGLRREKISYEIVGGLRFYERKEVKDLMAYMRLSINPKDQVSLKRVINVPARGIGKTTLDKVDRLAMDRGISFADALYIAAQDASVTSAGTAKKLSQFVVFLERIASECLIQKPSELFHRILDETGYIKDLKAEGTDEAFARVENLEELDSVLQEFEEDHKGLEPSELMPLFLEQTSLDDTQNASEQGGGVSAIQMMTLHASKGLEFPVVFMVGMEEGLFPSVKPWQSLTGGVDPDQELEEERRLCYVGITRARRKLYMTHVAIRRIWGQTGVQEPARFFNEIPDELIQYHDLSVGQAAARNTVNFGAPFMGATGTDSKIIGKTLDHPEYGFGRIISSDGSGDHQKVTVDFQGRSTKKFLYRFIQDLVE